VDLVHIGEPWITRILRAGDAVLWLPVKDVVPDFQWATIVYGPNLIEENPDAGQRFMVAYLEAVRQYNEGKTARNLEIVSKHTELDRDLLEEACWPAIHGDGTITAQSVLDFQEWGLERGLLDGTVTEEQFWDPSFAEHATQVLDEVTP
jgi:NitT/TauT family transport system substrate-binding protein